MERNIINIQTKTKEYERWVNNYRLVSFETSPRESKKIFYIDCRTEMMLLILITLTGNMVMSDENRSGQSQDWFVLGKITPKELWNGEKSRFRVSRIMDPDKLISIQAGDGVSKDLDWNKDTGIQKIPKEIFDEIRRALYRTR